MIVKYIKIFLAFITPIIGKALAQTAVDEINKFVYGAKPSRSRVVYRRQAPRPGSANWHRERQGMSPAPVFETGEFHDVLMVAFDLTGHSPQVVHE